MNLRKNSKVWELLVKDSDSPADFIKCAIRLRNLTGSEFADKMGITKQHYSVMMHHLKIGDGIGASMCLRIALVLDIDPYLVGRIVMEFKIRKLLENKTDTK